MKKYKKRIIIKNYQKIINEYKNAFILKNNESKVLDIINLKKRIKKIKFKIIMVKKTLIKIAIKNTRLEKIKDSLKGSNILVFSDNIIEILKKITEFTNEQKCLEMLAGIIEEKKINKKEMISIGRIKNKKEPIIRFAFLIKKKINNIFEIIKTPQHKILKLLKNIKK